VGAGLRLGRPTVVAMHLMWAHDEYIRLLRLTFHWTEPGHWESKDFEVTNEEKTHG